MGRRLSRLRELRAAGAALGAAMVVWRVYRAQPLPEVVRQLRCGPPLPPALRDPQLLRRVVHVMAPVLPPWGMGRCLKTALVLLHLWGRSGVPARLHLGVRCGGRAHAWLTAGDPDAPLRAGAADGFTEAAVL